MKPFLARERMRGAPVDVRCATLAEALLCCNDIAVLSTWSWLGGRLAPPPTPLPAPAAVEGPASAVPEPDGPAPGAAPGGAGVPGTVKLKPRDDHSVGGGGGVAAVKPPIGSTEANFCGMPLMLSRTGVVYDLYAVVNHFGVRRAPFCCGCMRSFMPCAARRRRSRRWALRGIREGGPGHEVPRSRCMWCCARASSPASGLTDGAASTIGRAQNSMRATCRARLRTSSCVCPRVMRCTVRNAWRRCGHRYARRDTATARIGALLPHANETPVDISQIGRVKFYDRCSFM